MIQKALHPTGRYFPVIMSFLFFLIACIGFVPSYQDINAGTLEPHWFAHVHGALMTSWLLVYILQSFLAATGRLKFHRQLGLFAVGLGVLVWINLVIASVRLTLASHPPQGHFLFDLLLMEFYGIISFGLFFTWGILARKRDTNAHKRLLTFATLVLLQAAVDRIRWLPMLGLGYPYVHFIYLDTLFIPLIVYDLITLKRIHKITWIACAFIIGIQLSVSALWGSPVWHKYWYNVTAPMMGKVREVKLTDSQSDALLGDYEGDPFGKITIIREGGKLFVKSADRPNLELGATSETELFMRTETVSLSFVKGPDGNVTEVIGHEISRRFVLRRLH